MTYEAALFCVVALGLGRTGMYGRNYVGLVDSERDTHKDIVVEDYVFLTRVSYTHAVVPFAPGGEKKVRMFYLRPVDVDYIGKK